MFKLADWPTDSSRRAVEAADNVVHAYDLNMGVPDTIFPFWDEETPEPGPEVDTSTNKYQQTVADDNNSSTDNLGLKRRRGSNPWAEETAHKMQATESARSTASRKVSIDQRIDMEELESSVRTPGHRSNAPSASNINEVGIAPGLRHTRLRDLVQFVINDGLRVGSRPESAIAQEIEGGEFIEVRIRSSSGEEKTKTVEWSVEPDVPDVMFGKCLLPARRRSD